MPNVGRWRTQWATGTRPGVRSSWTACELSPCARAGCGRSFTALLPVQQRGTDATRRRSEEARGFQGCVCEQFAKVDAGDTKAKGGGTCVSI